MKNNSFSLASRKSSFKNAMNGFRTFAKFEVNGKIQLICAISALSLGYLFNISKGEWIALLITISVVLAVEIVNSAIERVCDLYSKEYSPQIREIKDLSASAVLVTSVAAMINGILILVPRVFHTAEELWQL